MLKKNEWLRALKHDKLSFSGKPFSYKLVPKEFSKDTLVTIFCPDHGDFKRPAGKHYTYKGCPACGMSARNAASRSSARTKEEWLNSIQHDGLSFSGKPYTYPNLPDLIPSKTRVTVVCPDHGPWECYAHAHLKSKCLRCSAKTIGKARAGKPNHRRFTLEQAIDRAKEFHKGLDYSKVKSYTGVGDIWELRCIKHNCSYEAKAFTLIYDKARGCPECRTERIQVVSDKLSKDRSWQWADQLENLGYKIVSYTCSHEEVTLKCPEHGEFTLVKAYYLSQGWSICPVCRKGSSSPERMLVKALKDLGHRVELHRRDILRDREVDVYLPKYKIAIEVNGVYHHSTETKGRDYHADKQKRLEELGITLFSFTDFELKTKMKLALSMVQAKCGLSRNRTGARNTKIKAITVDEARAFFNKNHMQGFCGASAHLGAYVFNVKTGKPLLVSAASFSKPRFKSSKVDATWELIRFATLRNAQIHGALSKIISAFRSDNPGSIFSYANLRFGSGKAYKALGFEYLGRSAPGYFWIDKDGNQLSRYQTQVKDLDYVLDDFDETESEYENMKRHGYYQIWDCGNLRFLYK